MLRLLTLLVFTVQVHGESTCTLRCNQGAPCVHGNADFSDHPTNEDGTPLDFQVVLHSNGMHCACPHGWTGLTCNRVYEECDGYHKCYNGGNCIPGLSDFFGNEQLFCDCSDALDEYGNPFVGKYCEVQSKEDCGSEDLFCVNGGECNPAFPDEGPPCGCPVGFEGPHCEFKEGEGTILSCTLDCQNGGECSLGSSSQTAEFHDLDHLYMTNTNSTEDYMYCICPPGFGGKLCDIPMTACGTEQCYYGGTCITRTDKAGVEKHRCDCTSADYDDKSYAGRFCQFVATDLCSSDDSENGLLFCVNNGTCRADVLEGCDCSEGFYGASCEYVHTPIIETPAPTTDAPTTIIAAPVAASTSAAPSSSPVTATPTYDESLNTLDDCTLQCENEGQCRKGFKDISVVSNVVPYDSELTQTANDDFEHCVCPAGFVGLRCEHVIEICPGGEHVCLHGSKCVQTGDEHSCDCSASTTYDLAGSSCEHKSYVSCNTGETHPAQPRSFCVNGGICKALVSGTEEFPGCECPDDEWTGPHCELRNMPVAGDDTGDVVETPQEDTSETQTPQQNTEMSSSSGNGSATGVLVVGILALVTALFVLMYTYRLNKQERRRLEKERDLTLALANHRELDRELGYKSGQNYAAGEPEVYLGPPRDEDGHELHHVAIT